ncbi:OsmC family peroxiredoxin [Streptomyces sp. F001]|uniref:OsmC family protein n=1 Tax=Streptomyces sp. F001 TaxID=1510026 RepID=UPI00101E333A|nr:OsmC family protein [Streptomyces sp. F001]RZB13423.1 OsmC family peroxiredoxin [Streptomyces sp. F001]
MPTRKVHVHDNGRLARVIDAGPHGLLADEPDPIGTDTGPTPVELLLAGLGACTSMTVRMYAERKGWDLTGIEVSARTAGRDGSRERIVKEVELSGRLDQQQLDGLAAIADLCPVQRMLGDTVDVRTHVTVRPAAVAAV